MAQKIPERQIFPHRPGVTSADMRRLAARYGFRFYRTSVRCRNNHSSLRRTSTGKCEACRLERWRRWRDRHPEKALAHLERMLAAKRKV